MNLPVVRAGWTTRTRSAGSEVRDGVRLGRRGNAFFAKSKSGLFPLSPLRAGRESEAASVPFARKTSRKIVKRTFSIAREIYRPTDCRAGRVGKRERERDIATGQSVHPKMDRTELKRGSARAACAAARVREHLRVQISHTRNWVRTARKAKRNARSQERVTEIAFLCGRSAYLCPM